VYRGGRRDKSPVEASVAFSPVDRITGRGASRSRPAADAAPAKAGR
jgi:hypothetical protein